jgi:hypothetical protein
MPEPTVSCCAPCDQAEFCVFLVDHFYSGQIRTTAAHSVGGRSICKTTLVPYHFLKSDIAIYYASLNRTVRNRSLGHHNSYDRRLCRYQHKAHKMSKATEASELIAFRIMHAEVK